MNAAIRAVVHQATVHELMVAGIRHGFEGLLERGLRGAEFELGGRYLSSMAVRSYGVPAVTAFLHRPDRIKELPT